LFEQEREPEDVAAEFFDADQDGDMDLFVGSGGNNRPTLSKPMSHRLYLNDGKGNFSKKEDAFPLAIGNTSVVLIKDMDSDGDQDVFTASCSVPVQYGLLPEVAFYSNDGKGNFTPQELPWQAQITAYKSAAICDANGDKQPDILLMGNFYDNNVQMGRYDADYGTVLLNKGKGQFEAVPLNGLAIKGQVRRIRPIQMGKGQGFVLGMNSDSLRIIQMAMPSILGNR
jgi:hypothetical protein